ncbi:MAG: DUF1428 family protein [Bacteroidota bacterium]
MTNYIDGFVFPIRRIYLDDYKKVAEQVAEIWKAYGATAYFEWVGDDLFLEGTISFIEALNVKDDEAIIFGWVVFPSKAIRESANKKVPLDPRMTTLVGPLVNPERLIFDASRMVYGGFQPLVQSNE